MSRSDNFDKCFKYKYCQMKKDLEINRKDKDEERIKKSEIMQEIIFYYLYDKKKYVNTITIDNKDNHENYYLIFSNSKETSDFDIKPEKNISKEKMVYRLCSKRFKQNFFKI